jgi:hypothetical protein
MLRNSLIALATISALAAPSLTATPALACMPMLVMPHAAEVAAVRKALPQTKLSEEDKVKIEVLLVDAQKRHLPPADQAKAITEAMKMVGLPHHS